MNCNGDEPDNCRNKSKAEEENENADTFQLRDGGVIFEQGHTSGETGSICSKQITNGLNSTSKCSLTYRRS